jgi:hypothetical protein
MRTRRTLRHVLTQLTTDGLYRYVNAGDHAFGIDVDFGMIQKYGGKAPVETRLRPFVDSPATRSRILLIICGRACDPAKAGIQCVSPRFPESVALPRTRLRAPASAPHQSLHVWSAHSSRIGVVFPCARFHRVSSVTRRQWNRARGSRSRSASPPTGRTSEERVDGPSSAGRPDQ